MYNNFSSSDSSSPCRDPGSEAWTNGEQGVDWTDMEDLYSITEEEENFAKQHNLTMSALQQLKEEALSSVRSPTDHCHQGAACVTTEHHL